VFVELEELSPLIARQHAPRQGQDRTPAQNNNTQSPAPASAETTEVGGG
jgi:hypothetical protein